MIWEFIFRFTVLLFLAYIAVIATAIAGLLNDLVSEDPRQDHDDFDFLKEDLNGTRENTNANISTVVGSDQR